LPDTLVPAAGPPVEVALMASNLTDVGAISLRILFDGGVLQFQGLTSRVPGVSFVSNLTGSEIRAEWYDPTGGSNPVSLVDDTLLVIVFDPVGAPGSISPLRFHDACEIGDREGDPFTGVEYVDGACALSGSVSVTDPPSSPQDLAFYGSAPNPFIPSGTLTYRLPDRAHVDLSIYDVAGQRVATLVAGSQDAGLHAVRWDARHTGGSAVSPGVYFARLSALGEVRTRKIVLVSR
jgi:hypothetical protein